MKDDSRKVDLSDHDEGIDSHTARESEQETSEKAFIEATELSDSCQRGVKSLDVGGSPHCSCCREELCAGEVSRLQGWLESFRRLLPPQHQALPPPCSGEDGEEVDPYTTLSWPDIAEVEGRLSPSLCGSNTLVTLVTGDQVSGSWVQGRREGRGSSQGPTFLARGVERVWGSYSQGRLEGVAMVELEGGLNLTARVVEGRLEGVGVGRGVGVTQLLIQTYRRGRAVGATWRGLQGGGWLHGVLDREGQLTGEEVVYIYPDLRTCLVGRFQGGRMESAREGRLVGVQGEGEDLLRAVVRMVRREVYSYSPSTSLQLTVPPLLRDPYERRYVDVRPSLQQGAGEGVFAVTPLPAGTVACFYHGIYMGVGQPSPQLCPDYQIFMDWAAAPLSPSLDMLEQHWSSASYRASLGHKVGVTIL